MLHGQVLLPVVGQGLVESCIFLLGDLVRLASPDWLLLVHHLPLVGHLLDPLLLLLVLLVLVNFFNLRLVAISVIILLLLFLILVVTDFLLSGLLDPQGDRIVDELGVLLDKILKATLL